MGMENGVSVETDKEPPTNIVIAGSVPSCIVTAPGDVVEGIMIRDDKGVPVVEPPVSVEEGGKNFLEPPANRAASCCKIALLVDKIVVTLPRRATLVLSATKSSSRPETNPGAVLNAAKSPFSSIPPMAVPAVGNVDKKSE